MWKLIIILCLIYSNSNSQEKKLHVTTISDSLKKMPIESFIVLRDYYPGLKRVPPLLRDKSESEMRELRCQEEHVLVLFKQNGNYYLQKINQCYWYTPIMITSNRISRFLQRNSQRIETNILLPNSHIDAKGDTVIMTIDHRPLTFFYIKLKNNEREITVDWFDLEEFSGWDVKRKKNINYKHNEKCSIIKLYRLVMQESKKLEFNKNAP